MTETAYTHTHTHTQRKKKNRKEIDTEKLQKYLKIQKKI